MPMAQGQRDFDVVVVGGGAAGIGVTASLLRRRPDLRIGVIEPGDKHYYQPAWTLVGGGVFDVARTMRPTREVMPSRATWLRAAAAGFEPEADRVLLDDGRAVTYGQLIVCPGLRLAWEQVDGLAGTLGRQGVTSNYRYDLAPYTWELVRGLKGGRALFTQPAMPIKCAGAPQKAMYLACDHWRRTGALDRIEVEFGLAGAALFGVPAFVPPLMRYVESYGIALAFNSALVAVDGAARKAWFDVKRADGTMAREEKTFDMLHAVPPQVPHAFLKNSPLADAAGWCEVDPATLRHVRHENVFGLGDGISTTNAKTAAAARKQIVTVAENLLALREGHAMPVTYDGYGSCPLTVERGRIVLAEFGYGGKLLPTFPLDPAVPRRSAWFLKARMLPWIYWNGMLKGREWLARPLGN
ncbi:NAD(P)/FAD-dependent oxidoreductase [Achromobacter denitrificans]